MNFCSIHKLQTSISLARAGLFILIEKGLIYDEFYTIREEAFD